MLYFDGVLNYTPHEITIFRGRDLPPIHIESVGTCRAIERQSCLGQIDVEAEIYYEMGNWAAQDNPLVPLMAPPRYIGVEWLKGDPPTEGAFVIVSVLAAPVLANERPDLTILVPDTGPESAVRGQDGRIEGIRRIIVWHDPERNSCPVRLVQPSEPDAHLPGGDVGHQSTVVDINEGRR